MKKKENNEKKELSEADKFENLTNLVEEKTNPDRKKRLVFNPSGELEFTDKPIPESSVVVEQIYKDGFFSPPVRQRCKREENGKDNIRFKADILYF